jgi:lysine 2,3-aminomutase
MSSKNKPDAPYEIPGIEIVNDDVFQDRFDFPPLKIERILRTDIPELWLANPDIYQYLKNAGNLETARESLYDYLNKCESRIFRLDNDLHILEKATVRECVRAFKSIIAPINEKRTNASALYYLHRLAREEYVGDVMEVSRDFIAEFQHLFRGVAGLSGIYSKYGTPEKRSMPSFITRDGREAAIMRSDFLDKMAETAEAKIREYRTGMDSSVIAKRIETRSRVLKAFNGRAEDWEDYRWHLKNIIRNFEKLSMVVNLSDEEKTAISLTERYRIPFGITPYYASLIDWGDDRSDDHAVRAQVIPPLSYAESFAEHRRERGVVMDFMGEHDTSPIDLITRRYPEVLIIKPYNSCSQICVYCQRNWEIEGVLDPRAVYPHEMIDKALDWIANHKFIRDVLITGGDPLVLTDTSLDSILVRLSRIDHVIRIRIGTRMPVVLPFRITEKFCSMLGKYIEPGRRELCVVTHFEHPYEVTRESAQAVQKLRMHGLSVYNQQVFTFENSRRFETVALRRALRLIGVDPYYTFITKGKEETDHYRVPIARILQERKEEARLFPGLDRTDEPVFNVPRLGKNHLRSWQDHRLVMILPDGRRVYEFHPWEKYITPIPPYNYIDVSIYGYLQRLERCGENPDEYKTIWYYY